MPDFKSRRQLQQWKTNRPPAGVGKLRIIGGKFRGRQIVYSGDPITRPMKDYTREALFNLVGGWVAGKACFDLFAGTGAVGIEALSRGATRAIFLERHFPSCRIIKQNIDSIDPGLSTKVEAGDSFFWMRQFLNETGTWPSEPWVVFICPPYDLFDSNEEDLIEMIRLMQEAAPAGSLIVVESDSRFDIQRLPQADTWEIREYSPAVISVLKKP